MDAEKEQLIRQQASLAHRLTMPSRSTDLSENAQSLEPDGVDESDLVRSRETLIRKRVSQTRTVLPRTAELLGSRFVPLFRQYAEQYHFNGENAIYYDAIQFANWLRSRPSGTSGASPNDAISQEMDPTPWAADFAQWECVRLKSLLRPVCIYVVRLEYEIASWLDATSEPKKKRNRWCIVRIYGWTRILRLGF